MKRSQAFTAAGLIALAAATGCSASYFNGLLATSVVYVYNPNSPSGTVTYNLVKDPTSGKLTIQSSTRQDPTVQVRLEQGSSEVTLENVSATYFHPTASAVDGNGNAINGPGGFTQLAYPPPVSVPMNFVFNFPNPAGVGSPAAPSESGLQTVQLQGVITDDVVQYGAARIFGPNTTPAGTQSISIHAEVEITGHNAFGGKVATTPKIIGVPILFNYSGG